MLFIFINKNKGEIMSTFEQISKWVTDNLGGLLAIIGGLILLGWTYKIIISLALFFLGFFLIYFGLVKLKLTVVTKYIDDMIIKIKKLFQ